MLSQSFSDLTIRPAGPDDAPAFLELVAALADYEDLPPPTPEARDRLLRDGFGPGRRFEPILALWKGQPAGYAIIFETYSSFLALPTLYLEDLFVVPDYRQLGIGGTVLRCLAAEAVRRGCGRMEWTVLHWNELAQRRYRSVGARHLEEWQLWRLDGESLHSTGFGSER